VIPGAELRARREELGLGLREVAAATRIPLRYLEALEEERYDDIPAGPYAGAYTRALCVHLGIEVSSEPDTAEISQDSRPVRAAPLWFVRGIAGLTLAVLGVMLASLAWDLVSAARGGPEASDTMQEVTVAARQKARVTVRVDGVEDPRHDLLVGDAPITAVGRVIEVDAPSVSAVEIRWNGQPVRPQGRQGLPRTLRFVDDGG
jgi:Helix-turn-helix domain